MKVPFRLSPRVLAIASVVCFLVFVFSSSRAFAASTVQVKVGGQFMGSPLAKGGMVWFNGFDPGTIVIHPGDTVVWTVKGGVHTVTSAAVLSNGSFVFDSSPLFTTAGALADLGPGLLLAPGSVFDLDTSTLPVGTYTYFCKIHPGMMGNLTVTGGSVTSAIVNAIAGWGDHLYAVQAFAPENLTVAQGTIIRWTLMNPMEPHTITGVNATGALAWDSSPLFNPPGPPPVLLPTQSFSYTFNNPGTYVYFCKLHAYKIGESWVGMTGTVLVVPVTALDAVNASVSSLNSIVNGLAGVVYAALAISVIALIVSIYGVVRRKGGAPPAA